MKCSLFSFIPWVGFRYNLHAERSRIMIRWCALGMSDLMLFAALAVAGDREVANFALLDATGKLHELRRQEGKAVVLFFTANGCPVARQSAPKLNGLAQRFADRGVTFFLVNSNSADDRKSILKEQAELQLFRTPVLKDDTQGVARHLGVTRTGECV